MSKCENREACPFFTGEIDGGMPTVVCAAKQRYCHGDPTQCARYMVSRALGSARVPEELSPSRVDLAQALIVHG